MDNVILFVVEHKIKDCVEMLRPEIEKGLDGNLDAKTEKEIDHFNKVFSLFDRLNNILEFLEK